MDIAIESSRVHLNGQEDYLAVIVKLERGECGPLQLIDVQVRIRRSDKTRHSLFSLGHSAHAKGQETHQQLPERGKLNVRSRASLCSFDSGHSAMRTGLQCSCQLYSQLLQEQRYSAVIYHQVGNIG